MKKLFLFFALASLMFAVSSCNKYCVCKVTKDGKTIEEYDYSDEKLKQSECLDKVDETWAQLSDSYNVESLVGVGVTCDHL